LKDEPNAGACALELRVDSKAYLTAEGSPIEVIRGVALRLETGTFTALMGPSGCGKTTLLRIAAGLDSDFVGTRHVPPSQRPAIVFQEPRLLPWRTVEENIRLVLPAGEEAIDLAPLLDTLGLASHIRQYPGELSLGLARRVAIARAFAVRPTLLLLDEPFVSLDQVTAARLRDELAALVRRERVTTLCVTHDPAEAAQLADRLFVLSHRPAAVIFERRLSSRELPRGKAEVLSIKEELSDALVRVYGPTQPPDELRDHPA
jgi:ABC-type nitrate/sulfonate/bicarbonate transport system ATPase subunit